MPRTHLLILALGVLIVVFTIPGENTREAPVEQVLDALPQTARNFGAADLFMETAEISQFAADGTLAYRLRATSIVHYPKADHTLLEGPRLTFYRESETPWEVSAARGHVIGGTGLLDTGLRPEYDMPAAPGQEKVKLEGDVLVQRRRPDAGFLELRTELLMLFPGREYAETDRPVIIDSQSGRTTAEGLQANLAAGTIALGSPPRRVRTTIFPGTL